MNKTEVNINGMDKILKNLNKAISKIEGNSEIGLKVVGGFIKGEAQDKTPVDDGILINSADFKVTKNEEGSGSSVVVFYTAFYAAWVHEMPMTLKGQPREDFGETKEGVSFGGGTGKGKYWDGGENLFLKKATVENIPSIINKITKVASRNNVLK